MERETREDCYHKVIVYKRFERKEPYGRCVKCDKLIPITDRDYDRFAGDWFVKRDDAR